MFKKFVGFEKKLLPCKPISIRSLKSLLNLSTKISAMRFKLITIFLSCFFLMSFAPPTNGGNENQQTPKKDKAKINWISFEEAIEKNKKNPKKIFVDLYTNWCTWCSRMEKVTFENPVIAEYINENFYAVKFDAETKQDIFFKDQRYHFVPDATTNGVHGMALHLTRGRLNYPSVIFLDEAMENPQPVPGFQNPVVMDKLLKFFGEDFYKQVDWGLFNQIYQSPLDNSKKN